MAFTTSLYNSAAKKFLNQEVTKASLKVMLLNSGASFTASHSALNSVAGAASPHRANEVYGNGWTEGGQSIASVAATVTTTNDATLSGTDVRVRASGGSIGPATACVIYDDADASKGPLIYVDFGGTLTAGDGVDFLIPMTAILTATYT